LKLLLLKLPLLKPLLLKLPQMKLVDTYIAWTSEWLWHFEDWLTTGVWAGGGEHPQQRRKRWA